MTSVFVVEKHKANDQQLGIFLLLTVRDKVFQGSEAVFVLLLQNTNTPDLLLLGHTEVASIGATPRVRPRSPRCVPLLWSPGSWAKAGRA